MKCAVCWELDIDAVFLPLGKQACRGCLATSGLPMPLECLLHITRELLKWRKEASDFLETDQEVSNVLREADDAVGKYWVARGHLMHSIREVDSACEHLVQRIV